MLIPKLSSFRDQDRVGDGLVGRFDQMRDERRQITAFHIAGDMCDLHSVVAPVTGWGITALSTALICHVAHDDLRKVAATYPNLAMAFWRDTTVDASILAKWVPNVGRKDARARVAHLLCEMGMPMERAGLGTRDHYPLPFSQEQIGAKYGSRKWLGATCLATGKAWRSWLPSCSLRLQRLFWRKRY